MSRKNANNEGSIRKRANGTWEGRYTDGYNDAGRQIQRSVYGKTRKEVGRQNTRYSGKETIPALTLHPPSTGSMTG